MKFRPLLFAFLIVGLAVNGQTGAKADNTGTQALPKSVESLAHRLGLTFVRIPPGSFQMAAGSTLPREVPEHKVTLSHGLWMADAPVTYRQYNQFVEATGYMPGTSATVYGSSVGGSGYGMKSDASWKNPYFAQSPEMPVVCVNWFEAMAFIDWLNQVDPGHGYRLPFEAEFEYASLAGSSGPWFWGADPAQSQVFANTADAQLKRVFPAWVGQMSPWDDGFPYLAPVRTYKSNAWGLYDMVGNAGQWCADWLGGYSAKPQIDPKGPATGLYKVIRGGSWITEVQHVPSYHRDMASPEKRFSTAGFRVVADEAPADAQAGLGLASAPPATALAPAEPAAPRTGTLIGTWVGTYGCSQGLTGVTLTIAEATPKSVRALFHFYADPRNPKVPTGCFTMTGTYQANRKRLILVGDKWLQRPPGYEVVGFSGEIDPEGQLFTGQVVAPGLGCSTFSLQRGLPPIGTPPACNIQIAQQEDLQTAGSIRSALRKEAKVDLNILFAFNKAELQSLARGQLDELGRTLSLPDMLGLRFGIYGHTDAVGTDAGNQALSEARATAVRDYLVQVFQFSEDRFEVRGFGKTRLKHPDEPQSAENRRVEIVILK